MAKRFAMNWSDVEEKIEKYEEKKVFKKDDRFYQFKLNEKGEHYAVIRFLPSKNFSDVPYVKLWTHGVEVKPKSWYIENCPTTIGGKCPVCEANNEIYSNYPEEEAKRICNGRYRKLSYYANILVIKDKSNPENEGKVFLYRFPNDIFKKIFNMLKPDLEKDPSKKSVNVFDFYNGADFELDVGCKKDGKKTYPEYSNAQFKAPSELFGGDDTKLEEIQKQLVDITEFIAPSQFKDYADLKQRWDKVNGISSSSETSSEETNPIKETQAEEPIKETKTKSDLDFNEIEDETGFFDALDNE